MNGEKCEACGQLLPEGTYLQIKRQQYRISLREMAGATGIHPSTLHRAEQGHAPRIGVVLSLSQFYAVPIEIIVREMGWEQS